MMNLKEKKVNKFKLPDSYTLVLLNGSFQKDFSSGCFFLDPDKSILQIPQGTILNKPIHLLFLTSENHDSRIDIIIEKDSNLDIVEEHINLNKKSYKNTTKINIITKANSKINYYKLQNNNNNASHKIKTNITQEYNSTIDMKFIGKETKNYHEDLQVDLVEEKANYNAIGLISLKNTQNLNYNLKLNHFVPNCKSNILFKGIIADKAKGDFNCIITVHPGAIKTQTHVSNKNLLLSDLATMNTAPALKTYADDVICTHGATVGHLDQDALFYLQSRGLALKMATKILINAFVQEIIDQVAVYCKPKVIENLVYEY
jgi:Fe-S cluster assembly protein SufD